MKKFLVILMVVAMASFLFTGCLPTTNYAPVITSTPGETAIVGIEYSYTPAATDADGDTVTFSVAGPTGMAISAGVITWTPTAVGTEDVIVTATDGTDSTTQSFTITVVAAAPVVTAIITLAAIPGVIAPVTAATPVTTAIDTAQYTGTVAWSTATPFLASTAYTATITLTAKAGYTLTGVGGNFFTVAGATATNVVNLGVVSALFPATAANTIITLAAIPGVIAPVAAATPVTTAINTAQYTGTVAWVGAPVTFTGSTAYTATITLTAKAGYTLTGVGGNFFTVAGATATNVVNLGVVSALFPATAANTIITLAAIPGVIVPTTGAVPVLTTTVTAQYTGIVAWSTTPATFAVSTVYTATITLTAAAGYTFAGVAANLFTVAGATSDTNPINSGLVTAVFPATTPAPVVVSCAFINATTLRIIYSEAVTTVLGDYVPGVVTPAGTATSFVTTAIAGSGTTTITLTVAGYLGGVAAPLVTGDVAVMAIAATVVSTAVPTNALVALPTQAVAAF